MSVLDLLLLFVIICLLGVDGELAFVQFDVTGQTLPADPNVMSEMFAP